MDEQPALPFLRFAHGLKCFAENPKGCAKQKLLPDVLWIFNRVFVSNRDPAFFFESFLLIGSGKKSAVGRLSATLHKY